MDRFKVLRLKYTSNHNNNCHCNKKQTWNVPLALLASDIAVLMILEGRGVESVPLSEFRNNGFSVH